MTEALGMKEKYAKEKNSLLKSAVNEPMPKMAVAVGKALNKKFD